jgi:SAM-dependent methyltransferase
MKRLLSLLVGVPLLLYVLNVFSYRYLKRNVLRRRRWDLNICCGKTDGGGTNADIVRHRSDLPNFVKIDDLYDLPFKDDEFGAVLCSHTIEHVEHPERFWRELRRVGRDVTLVVPPLWDLSAAFNVLEHRWVFLTLRKEHKHLPPRVRLPLARTVQRLFGQRVHA